MTTVTKSRAKIARMEEPGRVAGARMVDLLHQIAEKVFAADIKAHGMQRKVADHVGLDRTLANKLLRDIRVNVGFDSIEAVAAKLKLRREYFHQPKRVNYEDFLVRARDSGARDDHHEAPESVLTPSECETLLDDVGALPVEREAFRAHLRVYRVPRLTATYVRDFMAVLRRGRRLQVAIDSATNAVADADAQAEGRKRIADSVPPSGRKSHRVPRKP
jgi:hypothetical protein